MSRTFKPKAVTLNDVASASGVSHQTVSRVINNIPQVADATRERVLAVVAELGYRPNPAARQLVTGTSKTVGIISFGTDYYGPAQMVGSVERALKRRGYGFVFASISSLSLHAIRGALRDLERHRVVGLILITPLLTVKLAEVQAMCQNLPFVMIDVCKGAKLPSILFDQAYGSEEATRHLLILGHRDICEISGPLAWSGALERHQAWLRTLQQAGVTPGPSFEGDWTAESGYRAAQNLRHPFTALVVGNDQMALATLHVAGARGLAVPRDLSVVSFDDTPVVRFSLPPLTAIKQPIAAMTARAAELLIGARTGPGTEDAEPTPPGILAFELVVRGSTAAPGG